VGIATPKPEFVRGLFGVRGGQNRRFEIADLSVLVEDQIAVRVADGFSAAAIRADVTDDRADFADGVLPLKDQHHDASAALGLGVGGEILDDVVPDQFLNTTILRVVGGDNGLGILLNQ